MPFLDEILAERNLARVIPIPEPDAVPIAETVIDAGFEAPIRKKIVVNTSGQRISSQVSDRELLDRMDDFLSRLDGILTKKDEETHAALATENTLRFAESKPAWMREE
jgi:predicted extracellular nuclease